MARERQGKGPRPPKLTMCPECKGRMRQTCAACEGSGWIAEKGSVTDSETGEEEIAAEVWANVGEFVRAWCAIEHDGFEAWLAMARAEAEDADLHPSAGLMEALTIFRGELARLEHQQECERQGSESRATKGE